jgi:hypothetical protein
MSVLTEVVAMVVCEKKEKKCVFFRVGGIASGISSMIRRGE